MTATPSISICLTSYNRAHLIGATIESLLAQDLGDFELLVQDNASSDGVEEVCRRYERLDGRVSFQANASNLAMPGNLNAAIGRARGEFIANVHDGDLYRPDLLRRWRDALVRQEAAFVFNDLEVVDHDGRTTGFHRHDFQERLPPRELTAFMLERFDSPVWGTVMARADAYRRHGLFKPEFSFIADVEMWMRLNLHHPVAFVAQPLIKITPHEADRPYAYVNWDLERAAVRMREETARAFHEGRAAPLASYLQRLARLRRKRWTFLAASCAKRRRTDLLAEAGRAFAETDDLVLRFLGGAARLVGAVGHRAR